MLVKTTLIFLLAMALVAMVGRALFPTALRRITRRSAVAARPATCPRCGAFMISQGPCPCTGPAKP